MLYEVITDAAQVAERLAHAAAAFASWRARPLVERTPVLSATAAALRSSAADLAALMTASYNFV